jgi:hypothetical protein
LHFMQTCVCIQSCLYLQPLNFSVCPLHAVSTRLACALLYTVSKLLACALCTPFLHYHSVCPLLHAVSTLLACALFHAIPPSVCPLHAVSTLLACAFAAPRFYTTSVCPFCTPFLQAVCPFVAHRSTLLACALCTPFLPAPQ